MERKKINFRIRELGLSRSQVSALTGIPRSDLGNFLNERGNLPARKVQYILNTLAALETGFDELQKQWPGLAFDTNNMDFLRRIIDAVSTAKRKAAEDAQTQLDKIMGKASAALSLPL